MKKLQVLQAVQFAFMPLSQGMNNAALKAGVGAALAVSAVAAKADSVIPAGTLTTVTTTAVDSVVDIATQGLPLITGVALGWFIVTGTKKLLSKGGIN